MASAFVVVEEVEVVSADVVELEVDCDVDCDVDPVEVDDDCSAGSGKEKKGRGMRTVVEMINVKDACRAVATSGFLHRFPPLLTRALADRPGAGGAIGIKPAAVGAEPGEFVTDAATVLTVAKVVGLAVGPQRNLERGAVAITEAVVETAQADPDGVVLGHASERPDEVLLRLRLDLGQAKV